MIMGTQLNIKPQIAAILASVFYMLLSPKWMMAPAAWVAPFFLLYAGRDFRPWKSYLLAVSVFGVSFSISFYRVMPFPGILFFIMAIIVSLQTAIPFWLHRVLSPKITGWTKTLIFPGTFTLYEYLSSFGGGGTWGSLAYTQLSNFYLMQTASITGIWGITFLITWFSSMLLWAVEEIFNWRLIRNAVFSFCGIFCLLFLYGVIRTNPFFQHGIRTVRVAAITGSNLSVLQSMYSDCFRRTVEIKEENLNQSSSELGELNKGFAAFIENPTNKKFLHSHQVMLAHEDTLFALSGREAQAGARIVAWSEALVLVIKSDEQRVLAKGKILAAKNKIHFLMTIGSIIPGKVTMGKKFIENKAILFDPEGRIITTFLKNRPVPVVEPSVAGDGKVPVVKTDYGNLATSICYDADFPVLIRQAGQQNADILLLPSGDWKEISPYHAQMASVRAIENGFSLVRPVSNAQTFATDCYGRIIGSGNYYDSEEKVVVANVPINHLKTLYVLLGDWFVVACVVVFSVQLVLAFKKRSAIISPAGFR
jgi:apolipoprotein N-acyltransferase